MIQLFFFNQPYAPAALISGGRPSVSQIVPVSEGSQIIFFVSKKGSSNRLLIAVTSAEALKGEAPPQGHRP
jgi:hypothetical protein